MTVFLFFSFLFGFHGDRFPTFSFLIGFHGVCFPTFSFLYGFHAIPIILLIMLINLLGHITYCYYLLYHVINTLPKKTQQEIKVSIVHLMLLDHVHCVYVSE